MPLRRRHSAALTWARVRAPRNVGRAMATRMPMISTTTINSIRVNPSSSPFILRAIFSIICITPLRADGYGVTGCWFGLLGDRLEGAGPRPLDGRPEGRELLPAMGGASRLAEWDHSRART